MMGQGFPKISHIADPQGLRNSASWQLPAITKAETNPVTLCMEKANSMCQAKTVRTSYASVTCWNLMMVRLQLFHAVCQRCAHAQICLI